MPCPASSDGSLSSPTYYSDSFSRYSTKNALQSEGKNRDLHSTTVPGLQGMALLITEDEFNKLVTILVKESSGGLLDTPDSVLKGQLQDKTKNLIAHLEVEYCFYYNFYSKLLDLYLKLMSIPETSWDTSFTQSGNSVPTGLVSSRTTRMDQKTDVLKNIAAELKKLNRKLTQITELNISISNTLKAMIQSVRDKVKGDANVDGSTAQLDVALLNLQASNPKNIIVDLETNRRSIEYTQEKNRYASIYLGLYAFLNISALAVLLHIASSE